MTSTESVKPTSQVWLAVRVIPRREKHIVKVLQRKGMESWIPLEEKIRRYKRKVRKVELPLITQYVFVNTSTRNLGEILSVDGVIDFVRPSGEISPIPEEEIILLKRVVGEANVVEVEAGTWEKGDEVEIIAGQLTGLKGRLEEWRGKKRLGISMPQFAHTMIIEVPIKALRKL
ncbi:MAG: UpxY family transcription antiterminator [Bacteroidetes bacterium]|jgi:transcription antitermination factor NusG|nr:UpxY family transcription antiterminator [Bacteroidota bacterium]